MASPRDINEGVPETLSNLVMDCVKVNPARRPEMTDLIRRLEIIEHVAKRNATQAGYRPAETRLRGEAVA